MAPTTRTEQSRIRPRVTNSTPKSNTATQSELAARRQARLDKELEIIGTGLDFKPPSKKRSYYWRGAWYETEEDSGSASSTTDSKRQTEDGDKVECARKKPRISLSDDEDDDNIVVGPSRPKLLVRKPIAPIAGKQKTTHKTVSEHPDETFRKDGLRQFKQLLQSRPVDGAHIVPFLEVMKRPVKNRIHQDLVDIECESEEAPEAYILTSPDARHLLASTASIHAPIFVSGGAKPFFENEGRRPIHAVLEDWYIDETEINSVCPSDTPVTISSLRKHFLAANGQVKGPWNLPEIPNPLADQAIPEFVSSLNCNILSELMRRLLDLTENDICQDSCEKRVRENVCCEEHRLTITEHVTLQDAWRQWHGCIMLADAGAITHGHWDQWSTGIWIACYEGEIGFCWQSHPTVEQRTQWHRDASKPNGTYLYKVLRAGDVVYMPPGTVHHVFRLPEGKQTLAMSAQILRRNALDEWLEILLLELQHAVDEKKRDSYESFVLPVVKLTARLVGQAKSEREIERFGGREKIGEVKALLARLEKLGLKLQRLTSKVVRAK